MTDLPSGAVTFLFTDIEGSTRLVKALREQYVQVLADHRRLVRAAIAGQAGNEIDTQGDAFFVAFASAKQAVLCALEIQRALAGHQWPSDASVRVRMGIHTGHAVPVEGAYTGLAVHRAARICSAARGGQVLVSQATQTLIEDDEEEELGFALAELGERRLKDLDRPVRLFELTVVEAVPVPLPQQQTATAPVPVLPPIVGRATELQTMSAVCTRALDGQSHIYRKPGLTCWRRRPGRPAGRAIQGRPLPSHGLATLGIIEAEYGDLEDGLADLQAAVTLACRVGSVEDAIRAAANRVHLLYRAGRFAEAVEAGRSGRSAVAAMGAPPAITSGIGNNAAAALLASGRWAEADQLLAELVAESTTNFTRYLQLLQLELAVGRGESERAADLAAILRKSPDDPRLVASLHACLAEQALGSEDLAAAAIEVTDGLKALSGAEMAEEELRLLVAAARLVADLALLSPSAPPGEIPDGWEEGRREQATRALTACQSTARELRATPLLTQANDLARQIR